ncbi:MAG: AtpZ/AtpI family protein [Planctomycetota bacterium]
MSDAQEFQQPKPLPAHGHGSRSDMEQAVGRKGRRRLLAKQAGSRSVWFGLGMFGVIGWSVAVPTLVGIAVGLWLDARLQLQRSWTLMLMIAGLGIGSWNAWSWVRREMAAQDRKSPAGDEKTTDE